MLLSALPVAAQVQPPAAGWASCSALVGDNAARLACFDRWAREQAASPALPPAATAANATANPAPAEPPARPVASTVTASPPAETDPCASGARTNLTRFWELDKDSDCGTFGLRGYRPVSLSWIASDGVNHAPSSPTAGHTATFTPYHSVETRIQLSVRTKIASGMLTDGKQQPLDSLWFAYTQQSYWQLFSGAISRPFRTTDHEPELTYIYPSTLDLAGGWRLRYSGISAIHQSNGQSLPLSRSWNRVALMAGLEHGDNLRLQARAWARLPESAADDDNPGISNYVGRAELAGFWDINHANTLGLTVRNSLRTSGRGSVRLEWLTTLGKPSPGGEPSSLRLHTQLFSGYGDSLVDYNRRRTVFSVGLSLVDF